jgi:hypothetical protein
MFFSQRIFLAIKPQSRQPALINIARGLARG